MITSFPPINYPNKPVPPFTAEPPRNPFPGFYPDMWRNITGKPYITVSSKGLANGQSEYFNDGADFGPDSLQADGSLTQTVGIQEAVNTGKRVELVNFGYYDIYAEIVPTVKNQNFVLHGAGAPEGSSGSIIMPSSENATIIRQNTAGQGIININMPVGNLDVGDFIGYFTQSTTGHGFASNPETWFASNPPASENDLPMTQGWIFGPVGMFGVDENHYGFRFANLGSTGYVKTIFGAGYGGFYSWHSYTPTTSFDYNFGNAVMTGYKIWQMSGTSSSVNIVDYSVGYPSGSTAIPQIGLIYSLAPIDILGISGTLTPYLIYFDPTYAVYIRELFVTADIPAGLTCKIGYSGNVFFQMLGAIGSNITVSPAGIYPDFSPQLNLIVSNSVVLDNNLSVDKLLYTNGGRNSGSFTPTISLSANPPVSGTVYQNTNPFDIEIDLTVYATTSGTAGYVTIAKGATSTPTAIGNQFVSGSTSSTSTDIIKLRVPAGWYYEFTGSGVTFATATPFAE